MFVFLKKFDLFGAPIPTFNIKGSSDVKTSLGGVLSGIIIVTVNIFAMMKFKHLIDHKNPSISTYENENSLEVDDVFDTTHEDFALAFALTNYMSGKPMDDPHFLRWYAVYWKKLGLNIERHLIPVHSCTDTDYATFKTPERGSLAKYERLKKEGSLKCIDWKSAGIDIYDTESGADYGGLDILVLPCNNAWPIPRSEGGTDQGVSDDCNWDQKKTLEHLYGGLNIDIMNNFGKFKQKQFGENSIEYGSHITEVFVNGQTPNFVDMNIRHRHLEDQSQYLQLGTTTSFDFYDVRPGKSSASSY